jgi:SpoVK/Ycf46/Vps4 family AAA+-type ATPase
VACHGRKNTYFSILWDEIKSIEKIENNDFVYDLSVEPTEKFVSGWTVVHNSESNTRNVLATIEAIAPCVLFIDEMEKGLSGVQSSNFSDGGTSARVVGTFLSWMQDKKSDVILVATANNISLLPPELKRSGRWDGIFFVDLPDEIERMAIFAIHLIKRKRDPKKYNLEQLMMATNNFTGAEIEQVVKTALVMAFYEKKELDDTHLIKAVRDTVPIYETAREDIEFLRDWVHINKDGQGTRAMLAKRKVV